MFIDTARITLKAGKGGNGVNSFYRDKLTMKGHPDGGDGGEGGDVIIRVSTDVHTLIDFQYRRIFKARDGAHGSSKQKKGKDGEPLIINVPAGTIVYNAQDNQFLRDLVTKDDSYTVVRGGSRGRGNRSHKDATAGTLGDEKEVFLELKLIADVGIIGFPNAGKSTLLSRISKAHPKIADFPFTTKNPVLGVVTYGGVTFTVAEIPGLIEDSHKGKGLGDRFLRHAERTRIFIHLLDLSKPTAEDVLADYYKIHKELRLYSRGLIKKPQLVVCNKIDLPGAGQKIPYLRERLGRYIIAISGKEARGLDRLLKMIVKALPRKREDE